MAKPRFLALLGVLLLTPFAIQTGCGDDGTAATGGDGDGDGDGDGGTGDGDGDGDGDGGTASCTPEGTQCNNCVDDDADGDIDGADIHCISALDDDESSFQTGISGDNVDKVKQDCFFDGDSGAGNDGCDYHTCCLLGAQTTAECIEFGNKYGFNGSTFDPATDCEVSNQCVMFCADLAPPGCDCFSCCTICNDTGCYDVSTHPLISPDCDVDTLDDPDVCVPCTKTTACEEPCDPEMCILCPGQDESDLPAECGGENQCPDNQTPCDSSDDCGVGEFCNTGCCVPQVD